MVVAVILTTVFTTVDLNPDSPTMAPTSEFQGVEAQTVDIIVSALPASEGVEAQTLDLIVSALPASKTALLSDENGPQKQALDWVTNQSFSGNVDYTADERILTRFGLATLFLSTSGEFLKESGGCWLSKSNECEATRRVVLAKIRVISLPLNHPLFYRVLWA
jgi:hypothetical protein